MNKILTLSALAVSMASTAIAGSATPSATDVAIMAPAPLGATDWSGLYFGASAGVANGNLENILLVNDDLDNNSLFGAFAGYNQQRGNLVFGGEVEFTLTPIVRIWCLLAAESLLPDEPALTVAPRPIPRGGMGAYRFNPSIGTLPSDVSIFPGVNVQVLQKNTSATDNTDLPVYDLGSGWSSLNTPPSVPVIRRAPEPVFSFPTELKDED